MSIAATAAEARAVLAPLPLAVCGMGHGPRRAAPRWGHDAQRSRRMSTSTRHAPGPADPPAGAGPGADAAPQSPPDDTPAPAPRRRSTSSPLGIRTLGQYAALPAAELSSRLGPLGPRWQRAACGQDMSPLVPLAADEPFEASLAWNGRSRAWSRCRSCWAGCSSRWPRGSNAPIAAPPCSTPNCTSPRAKQHVRTLQLPAPMREAKTLRTLILLDLESHPPNAAIDRVVVRVQPDPGADRPVVAARTGPAVAGAGVDAAGRLSALMGESHVGSPQLVDSWRPGAFAMRAFHGSVGAGAGARG